MSSLLFRRAPLVLVFLQFMAVAAFGQTIAGTVRDDTGAVMPGVTVEASSPALIEKTRTAVTDGAGQYKIVNLSPGVYTVTFTLPGFHGQARRDRAVDRFHRERQRRTEGRRRSRKRSPCRARRRSSTCSR